MSGLEHTRTYVRNLPFRESERFDLTRCKSSCRSAFASRHHRRRREALWLWNQPRRLPVTELGRADGGRSSRLRPPA